MKLIVQIPCYNEEETLAQTISDIPRDVPGFAQVELLVVDDGSTDKTIEVAQRCGVDHLLINKNNKGLARAYRAGIDMCLMLGADVVVNTDADNQYVGADIPKLVQPILDGAADVVVGDRQTHSIEHFSPLKKYLQNLGSKVVRKISGTTIPDTVSGFRAISREAAIQLNIISPFSYTIEMIIQAGAKHLAITSVPVRTNPETRKSRLFSSVPRFIERQLTSMVRMYAMYRPMRFFFLIGLCFSFLGLLPIIRFLFYFFTSGGAGHIQSLILGGVFLMMGFIAFIAGLLSDLMSHNRQLMEMTLEKVRRIELENARQRVE